MDSEQMLHQGDTRHGFMPKDAVPWDYYAIPARIWRVLKVMPNGCWVAPTRSKGRWYQKTMVDRLTRRSSHEALAITPTCADQRCCNPSHLCVVWSSALSIEEEA